LLVNSLQLFGTSFLDIFEYVWEKLSKKVKQFKIVLFNCHLDIQAYELTHVPVGEGVLGSKNRPDLKDSLEISHDAHLFVKLGGLGKTSFFIEITESEYVGSSFGWPSDQLGSMNFDEVIIDDKLSEYMANWRGQFENSLFSCGSQINDSVV